MGDLNFQIEKIAGHSGENAECGVINKKIVLAEGEVGNLVCCLLVYDANSAHRQDAVRDIFEITERKLEGATGSTLDVLKEVLESSQRYLQEQGIGASFLIAFFYKNVCYIARYGEKVKLIIFEETKKSEIDFETGSGPVSGGQTYLIATSKFLELFNEGTFKREEIELSEIIDGLATEISANDDQAEIGAVFVRVKEPDKTSDEEVLRGEDGKREEIAEEAAFAGGDIEGDGEEAGSLEGVYGTEEQELADKDTRRPRNNFIFLFVGRFFKELGRIRIGEGAAIFRLRRNILIFAVLIIAGLGLFAGYTVFQKNNRAREVELKGYLDLARSKLNEGAAIIELNKTRAREILVDAQKQAEKAEKINSRDPEVSKVIAEIESKLKETEQTTSINFAIFAEVGSMIQAFSFNGSKIEVFGKDKIFELDSGGKVIQEYEGISSVKSGAVYDNKAFVLTETGAERLDFSSGKISKIADFVARDIGVFFGNVYFLGNNQITKFVPIESGYAEPRDYLEKQEEFGDGSRMAIDSLVWVTKGNKVLKFNRGVLENFEIRGMPLGGGDFGLIFTDSALANLYVVDRTNSVLLVIDKNGEYKRALSSEEFGKASGILVNDSEDKVYISVSSKILSTGLK